MILKAPTALLGVGGGNATSAEDSTKKARHVMSTTESQRCAEMGCESWTNEEKTVRDAKVSRKTAEDFVNIWEEERQHWCEVEKNARHGRSKRLLRSAQQAHKRGWCSEKEHQEHKVKFLKKTEWRQRNMRTQRNTEDGGISHTRR